MVEMEVFCVWVDSEPEDQWVVILREVGGERALPMSIGVHEARAIQWGLERAQLERPMTHDLMASCVAELSDGLERVEITHCHDGVYYAELVIAHDGQLVRVDARPSDASALALRCEAPLFASEEALASAGVRLVEQENGFALVSRQGDGEGGTDDEFRRIISEIDDLDLEDLDS
jgi:bifunctional DNase/RNase